MRARWPCGLERWTDDRVVRGSNPAGETYFASEMCNLSWTPHSSLEKDNWAIPA